jgi:hypothetical protein
MTTITSPRKASTAVSLEARVASVTRQMMHIGLRAGNCPTFAPSLESVNVPEGVSL